MLNFIAKIIKRGKRKRHIQKNSPWGIYNQTLFKRRSDGGDLYVIENYHKKQDKSKFPK